MEVHFIESIPEVGIPQFEAQSASLQAQAIKRKSLQAQAIKRFEAKNLQAQVCKHFEAQSASANYFWLLRSLRYASIKINASCALLRCKMKQI